MAPGAQVLEAGLAIILHEQLRLFRELGPRGLLLRRARVRLVLLDRRRLLLFVLDVAERRGDRRMVHLPPSGAAPGARCLHSRTVLCFAGKSLAVCCVSEFESKGNSKLSRDADAEQGDDGLIATAV